MTGISIIDGDFIAKNTNFNVLIKELELAFAENSIEAPLRHHHDFPNPKEGVDATLLLMPAWNPGNTVGVKIITVNPNNTKHKLPSIQGSYIYMDAHKGNLMAILDAPELTVKRTAAASALASKYLSRRNASKLLMVGTGALSVNLIRAHATVRPITEVFVWGQDPEKAKAICRELQHEKFNCTPVSDLDSSVQKVDIISCATLSETPLIKGEFLIPGQHIDLVGSYKTTMREADDTVIQRASVFVDTFQGGLKESGDIVIPMQRGILKRENIGGDLFTLCANEKKGRKTNDEITCFKSVGHALEDLVAAEYYYKKFVL